MIITCWAILNRIVKTVAINLLTPLALVPNLAVCGFTVKHVCGSGNEFNFLLSFADSSMISLYLSWNVNQIQLVYSIILIFYTLFETYDKIPTRPNKFKTSTFLDWFWRALLNCPTCFQQPQLSLDSAWKQQQSSSLMDSYLLKYWNIQKLYSKGCNISFATAQD